MEKFLLDFFEKNWTQVTSAPLAFVGLFVLSSSLAMLVSNWYHAKTIAELKATNESQKERLILRTEQVEQYREKAVKYDEKLEAVVDASPAVLTQKALEFVSQIRDFIAKHQGVDRATEANEWSAMTAAVDEESKNRLWNAFTTKSNEDSSNRNLEWERRFKVDAMLLRDELRSRLKDYVSDRNIDMFYEHPTNYFGFNDVASDLERMAKLLK